MYIHILEPCGSYLLHANAAYMYLYPCGWMCDGTSHPTPGACAVPKGRRPPSNKNKCPPTSTQPYVFTTRPTVCAHPLFISRQYECRGLPRGNSASPLGRNRPRSPRMILLEFQHVC